MTFQLGSVLLDACVLAVLSGGDAYGYVLTQKVKEVIDISESSLYPVLRRLKKDGCLTTFDKPFGGRNRRYYSITEKGRERLKETTDEWKQYKVKVDKILSGGISNG